jgi:hypothetical protein
VTMAYGDVQALLIKLIEAVRDLVNTAASFVKWICKCSFKIYGN